MIRRGLESRSSRRGKVVGWAVLKKGNEVTVSTKWPAVKLSLTFYTELGRHRRDGSELESGLTGRWKINEGIHRSFCQICKSKQRHELISCDSSRFVKWWPNKQNLHFDRTVRVKPTATGFGFFKKPSSGSTRVLQDIHSCDLSIDGYREIFLCK